MVIERGEIWIADLPPAVGSEPGFRRPVVIVQTNSFNRTAINTVIAATITKNLQLLRSPGNVEIPREISGLKWDSVVNISQIITLDKSWLLEKVSKLPQQQLAEIEAGLRLVLELP